MNETMGRNIKALLNVDTLCYEDPSAKLLLTGARLENGVAGAGAGDGGRSRRAPGCPINPDSPASSSATGESGAMLGAVGAVVAIAIVVVVIAVRRRNNDPSGRGSKDAGPDDEPGQALSFENPLYEGPSVLEMAQKLDGGPGIEGRPNTRGRPGQALSFENPIYYASTKKNPLLDTTVYGQSETEAEEGSGDSLYHDLDVDNDHGY